MKLSVKTPKGEVATVVVGDPVDGYRDVSLIGPGTIDEDIGRVYLNDDGDPLSWLARLETVLGGDCSPFFGSMVRAVEWLVDARREFLVSADRPTGKIGVAR